MAVSSDDHRTGHHQRDQREIEARQAKRRQPDQRRRSRRPPLRPRAAGAETAGSSHTRAASLSTRRRSAATSGRARSSRRGRRGCRGRATRPSTSATLVSVVIQSEPTRLGSTTIVKATSTTMIAGADENAPLDGRREATRRSGLHCPVAKPCSRAYCAVREMLTTRCRDSQRSARMDSTNGVAER